MGGSINNEQTDQEKRRRGQMTSGLKERQMHSFAMNDRLINLFNHESFNN